MTIMEPPSNIRHAIANPPDLAEPVGFAHAVAAAAGRLVFLGGQIGCDGDGMIASTSLVHQLDAAAANVVRALAAVGGQPADLTQMVIYVTDMDEYRARLPEIGGAYRHHFGRHYVATSLIAVTALFDPAALVELVCTAVVPDRAP